MSEDKKLPVVANPDPDGIRNALMSTDLINEFSDSADPTKGINLKIIDPEKVDKNMMIILLGKDEDKFGICQQRFRVIKQKGDQIILEPYDEKGTPEARKEIARFIVQMNEQQIKSSAVDMVEKALNRKPIKKLERLKEQTKKGMRSKLSTSVGCVYLVIGDEEILL